LRIFVPSSSKNLDAALRYLNWLSIFDNFHFLQIGNEGVNHVMENGVPRVISAGADNPWIQNSPNNIDLTMPMNGIELLNPKMNAMVLAQAYGNTSSDVIVDAYGTSTNNGRSPPVYQATTTKDGIYGETLRDKADALIAQAVIARTADFDRVWDTGMRDYLSSGAQEIMDERASLWKQ
jgi:putative aldouronate transport system substrate-binding protein